MFYRLYISELLTKLESMESDEEKISLLKEHDTVPLRQVLYANYSDNVKFLLPAGPSNYIPNKVPIGIADTNLFREGKKLYLFVEGGHKLLKQERREEMWIHLLEALQYQEAEVLENLKNKNFEARYKLSRDVVEKAYPTLLETRKSSVPVSSQDDVKESEPKKKRGRPIGSLGKKKRALLEKNS